MTFVNFGVCLLRNYCKKYNIDKIKKRRLEFHLITLRALEHPAAAAEESKEDPTDEPASSDEVTEVCSNALVLLMGISTSKV